MTPTLKHITRTTVADVVRVTLEFDREVEYQQERLEGPARLYFDLKNTQTAAALQDAAYSYSDTSVRHIRLGRPKQDMTRLVIDLAGVEKYSVFELYNPYRLTIDLQRTTPKLEPLVARRVNALSNTAPRLASAHVPHDLDMLHRIPPRPLPHPLADTPMRVTSRPVAWEMASLLRVRPIAGRRRDIPMSAPVAMAPVGAGIAAEDRAGCSCRRRCRQPPRHAAQRARDEGPEVERGRLEGRRREREAEEGHGDGAARGRRNGCGGRRDGRTPDTASAAAAAQLADHTLPAPSAPSANTAGGFSLARQLGLGVARIVIDPGHGGHDPGNLGSKVNESELVLDVALRLEKLLLNEPGFEVVMTRRTDVFIPLEERPAIANREQADLFLSIHANASRNRQASGVETYYLNFASNPEAEEVAARENAGAAQTMNHLPEIVRAIAMNNKLDESRDFARVVQSSMVGRLKSQNSLMKDRGVKQAPFVVLIGAGMPSVLAEVAFLSHQQEASLMKTKDYRQKVAEALFEAVKNYQRSLKAVGTVASIDEDQDDQDEPREAQERARSAVDRQYRQQNGNAGEWVSWRPAESNDRSRGRSRPGRNGGPGAVALTSHPGRRTMDQALRHAQQQQPQPATPPPATSPSQPGAQAAPSGAAAGSHSVCAGSDARDPQPAQPRFNPQQVTPVVQIQAPRPADEVGVADVLIGSFALIGFLIVAALVVGLVTGGIFIAIRRWRDKNSPDSTEPQATRLKLSQ